MRGIDFKTQNLTFFYPQTDVPAIENVNIEITSGEFVLICGKSGCGKTTLLRMLKPELTPVGEKEGSVLLFGVPSECADSRMTAEKIGFVLQNPDFQAVTHTVRSELAFGLESLGLDSGEIRLRMGETASYFGLDGIFDSKISELSGGQLQLVCLASVMAMHPKAILLDEPVSMLDPMMCDSFLHTLRRLCDENGTTVVMTEHRLDSALAVADRLIFMDGGHVVSDSAPQDIDSSLLEKNEYLSAAIPAPVQLFAKLCPGQLLSITVGQARQRLNKMLGDNVRYTRVEREENVCDKDIAVEMKDVYFSYENGKNVLYSTNLKVKKGSFFALMGANAAGKTTALSLMSGLIECQRGKIRLFGKNIKKYSNEQLYSGTVAVLPQRVHTLFAANTVMEDLMLVLSDKNTGSSEKESLILEQAKFFGIDSLLTRHPYDLSAGEMQRAALCMAMLREPRILFLDEPTKGMDALFKREIGEKLRLLTRGGMTVIAVSHDCEFCAEYCDECAMLCDGFCAVQKKSSDFFCGNFFYTTAANRLSRDVFENAVTGREVLELCEKNLVGR